MAVVQDLGLLTRAHWSTAMPAESARDRVFPQDLVCTTKTRIHSMSRRQCIGTELAGAKRVARSERPCDSWPTLTFQPFAHNSRAN